MEGLQRSEISFRRQGSSGLVWDDKLLSGELKRSATHDLKQQPNPTLPRTRSNGGGEGAHGYRTVDVAPALDPPSPKVSGCGLCGMFGKPVAADRHHPHRKHVARKS